MTFRKLLAGAGLALSGGYAMAADLPARTPVVAPAPIFATVSGYVEAGLGVSWADNHFTYGSYSDGDHDRGWQLAGAGRGNVWIAPNFSVQADVWGASRSAKIRDCVGCGSASGSEFNIGGHVSYRDPDAYLVGVYGALGNVNPMIGYGFGPFGSGLRNGVIGLEGQAYFGNTTFYAQGGYGSTISAAEYLSGDGWNARGVVRQYFNPNLRLSVELGYSRMNFDSSTVYLASVSSARQVNWGAGLENKFGASPFSAFLKYEGAETKTSVNYFNGSLKSTSHAVTAGFRIYFNEGTLLVDDRSGATLDIRSPVTNIFNGLGVNMGQRS